MTPYNLERHKNKAAPIKLYANERILWQGKPKPGIHLSIGDIFYIPYTIPWSFPIFAALLFIAASIKTNPSLDNIAMTLCASSFFMPFIFAGIHLTIGRFIYQYFHRRFTTYLITNLRIIVFTKWLFSSKQHALKLQEVSVITKKTNKNDYGSIAFEPPYHKRDGLLNEHYAFGFYYLQDVSKVYELVVLLFPIILPPGDLPEFGTRKTKATAISRELLDDEVAVWSGKPIAWHVMGWVDLIGIPIMVGAALFFFGIGRGIFSDLYIAFSEGDLIPGIILVFVIAFWFLPIVLHLTLGFALRYFEKRNTQYLLTNSRALIITDFWRRTVTSVVYNNNYEVKRQARKNVIFKIKDTNKRKPKSWAHTIGFQSIHDAQEITKWLQWVQGHGM